MQHCCDGLREQPPAEWINGLSWQETRDRRIIKAWENLMNAARGEQKELGEQPHAEWIAGYREWQERKRLNGGPRQ